MQIEMGFLWNMEQFYIVIFTDSISQTIEQFS
jgi:hypothetical protein